MIDVRELRIGNVLQNKFTKEYKTINCELLSDIQNGYIDSLIKIELTEELLLKLGFNKHNELHLDEFMFYFYDNKIIVKAYTSDDNEGSIATNVKHLHTFQNLFYSLTGEELTLKND